MSKFSDLAFTQVFNQQMFQGTYTASDNIKALLFNPRNSGLNFLITQFMLVNTRVDNQPIPISSFAPFTYIKNSNGQTPATTSNVMTNILTSAAGPVVLNTDAAFTAAGPHVMYGQTSPDIQGASSVSLFDYMDPTLNPIVMYPGDAFGAFFITTFTIQVTGVTFT